MLGDLGFPFRRPQNSHWAAASSSMLHGLTSQASPTYVVPIPQLPAAGAPSILTLYIS